MALALATLLMVFILLENLLVLLETMIQFFVAITIINIFLPSLIVLRSELGDQFNGAFDKLENHWSTLHLV